MPPNASPRQIYTPPHTPRTCHIAVHYCLFKMYLNICGNKDEHGRTQSYVYSPWLLVSWPEAWGINILKYKRKCWCAWKKSWGFGERLQVKATKKFDFVVYFYPTYWTNWLSDMFDSKSGTDSGLKVLPPRMAVKIIWWNKSKYVSMWINPLYLSSTSVYLCLPVLTIC